MARTPHVPNPYVLPTGEHAADRLVRQQAITSDLYLHGEPPPTTRQISAVLHALADFTLQQHMLGDEVLVLGDRPGQRIWPYGTEDIRWAQAVGIGRLFHGMGDHLDEQAFVQSETESSGVDGEA